MTATIHAFPTRKADRERLALVGETLKVAVPITSSDAELDLLIQIGGTLLDNLNEYTAIDSWLVRLNAWEAQTPISG